MERLTQKDEQGNKLVLKNSVECFGDELRHWSISKSTTGTQTIRGYAIDKFAEYEDLEERGLLLKLPCKVGDTVYRIWTVGGKRKIAKFIVEGFKLIDGKWTALVAGGNRAIRQWNICDFGKTVFLTKDEVEEALKRMEGEEWKHTDM